MSYFAQISSLHIDILREIGNIGAGNAATALAKMMNKKITMEIPNVRVVSFNEMLEMAGGAEKVAASVYFRIEGEISFHMFFIMQTEQAVKLIRELSGNSSLSFAAELDNEFASSALKELGNILVSSYIASLSDFTGLKLYLSVPAICIDMLGAVLSYGFIETSQFSDDVIVIETAFHDAVHQSTERFDGHFFLFPDPASFAKIFRSLGAAADE